MSPVVARLHDRNLRLWGAADVQKDEDHRSEQLEQEEVQVAVRLSVTSGIWFLTSP